MATSLDDRARTRPPSPPDDRAPAHPSFPPLLAAALTLMVVAACTSEPSDPGAAASPAPAASGGSARLKELETKLEGLEGRIKDLNARADARPRPAPPADLGPLRSQLDDLAKSTEALGPLTKAVDSLDDRIGGLDKSLADIRADIAALKSQAKAAADAGPAAASASPAAGAGEAGPADFEQGAGLFESGKYKEASDVFRKLTETRPQDARVWYYAALSHGFATGNWMDDTERLVLKGVEREKAGTPKGPEIDAAFAKLSTALGKEWLDHYRKTARK